MSYQIIIDSDRDCYLVEGDYLRVDFDGEPDPHGGTFPTTHLNFYGRCLIPVPDQAGNALYMLARHLPRPDEQSTRRWAEMTRKVAREHGWDGRATEAKHV